MSPLPSPAFWRGKRVLLTGHTGFKGSWAAAWLRTMGAEVAGLALPPETVPSLHALLNGPVPEPCVDVRDAEAVARAVAEARPRIVLHMAAQALVRRSYRDPAGTFATNLGGTVTLLEALRRVPDLEAVLVVTSDKVYDNPGGGRPLREDDRLGGADPYSASKAACELAVASFRSSYFAPAGVPLATARAGNVIGGGDWSEDRIVPDLWRARRTGRPVEIRYPEATRPWQHVLEPVGAYLVYLEALAADRHGRLPTALNIGPSPDEELSVLDLARRFADRAGAPLSWCRPEGPQPPEKPTLTIDAGLIREALGWRPRLSMAEAVDWTAAWYAAFDRGEDMRALTLAQIADYCRRPV